MSFRKMIFRLLPKRRIQIGKTSKELDSVPAEYFEAKDCVRVVARQTADCEYPVLLRELSPTQMNCPVCHEITLAGLSYCDKCGAGLIKKTE